MSEWTTVQFPSAPDLGTRKAIIRWMEDRAKGRFMPFNHRDHFGRLSFGFEFECRQDAALFRSHWIERTPAGAS